MGSGAIRHSDRLPACTCRRAPRVWPLVAIAIAILCAGSSAEAARRGRKGEPPEPTEPTVTLRVAPRHGFRPLELTLTGSLFGVRPDDQEFCHAGLEWETRTPSGLTVSSKEDPRCLHPPEQILVQYTFTKAVTLDIPGIYTYRLIVHRKDGARVLSNTQEVRVLSNQ